MDEETVLKTAGGEEPFGGSIPSSSVCWSDENGSHTGLRTQRA